MPEPTPPQRAARVQELVFRYLERVEEGERPAEVLAALAGGDGQLADELARAVSALGHAGLLAPSACGSDQAPAFPERLGDFHLLRRLGAGAMGVVYLARQESLGREVALKLVRPDQLYFEGARARFRREVESAARLAHPGIAQVHTVGEHEGLPFFAQEYVRGASLEAVLAATPERAPEGLSGRDLFDALCTAMDEEQDGAPSEVFAGTWVQACLRIARQVTDALQHAHERGVLHRDVKPSNVLLTPDGRAVLVDFGLASLAGTDRLTRSGSQVGSLHYLAPEQLEEGVGAIGPRCDVYSLGVTLYELVTLRTPYSAPSVPRLLREIAVGAAPAPRRLNPAMPVDAATVCLTAMAREPGRRYPTAAALAADLANVLARRPITARPAGPLLRATRWAQRRPASAAALALGALVVVGGPLAFGLQRAAVARELGTLNADLSRALAAEQRERTRAEAHFEQTLAAVEFLLRRTGAADLVNTPRQQRLRLELVDRALELFVELEAERPDDARLRREHALLRRSRGDVLFDLGRYEEALAEYDAYMPYYEAQLALDPGRPETLQELAAALNAKARALGKWGRTEEALALTHEGLARMRAAFAARPENATWRLDLATMLTNHAMSRRGAGEVAQCEAAASEALALCEEALARAPQDARAWMGVGLARKELALCARERGEARTCAALLDEAIAEMERADALQPGDRARIERLAVATRQAADGRLTLGELERGEELARRSLERLEALARDFPGVPLLALEVLASEALLSRFLRARGELADARALLERVARARGEAADADPADRSKALAAAIELGNWSNAVLMDPGLGRPRFARAIELAERGLAYHARAEGDGFQARQIAAWLEYQRANACSLDNRPGPALAAIERMEEVASPQRELSTWLADAWAEWGRAVARTAGSAEEVAVTVATERSRERALAHLADALESGLADAGITEGNPAFEQWRGDPEFEALRAELLRRAAR